MEEPTVIFSLWRVASTSPDDVFTNRIIHIDFGGHLTQPHDIVTAQHRGNGLRTVGDIDLLEDIDGHIMARVAD